MLLFIKEHNILRLGTALLPYLAKKPAAITRSQITNDIFKFMSTTTGSLKSILQPAKGKDRLQLLLKLCDLPSFWGEADELPHLEEARQTAASIAGTDEQARTVYLLARYYMRKANYEHASGLFIEAMRLYDNNHNTRGKIDCQVRLSAIDNHRSQFETALQSIQQVIDTAAQASYNKGHANALHVKANILQNLGKLPEALAQCNKELEIFESVQDIYGMATAYHNIAVTNDSMGQYSEALDSLDFALKIREDIGDRFGITESLNQIGGIHWKRSSHLEGLKYLFRALKIEDETGDKHGMAVTYNFIGNINSNLGNYEDALKYYERAQKVWEELGNKKGIAALDYNLGIVHYESGNYDVALQNHLKSLELNTEIGYMEGICASLNYTGKIYAALGNYEEALRYQLEALKVGNKLGNKRRIGIALTGIGATFYHLGNYVEATQNLLSALETGRELGEKTIIKDALHALVEVCKKKNEFEAALEYYDQYYQVQNQISSESIQKQITTLNFQHSLEVKEKESALLKEKNEEVQRYLHKLEISNNELKQFAHVAAHDLREPLRMISSYIGLLEQSVGGNLNEAQKKFIGFAIDGSKRMELLIEDMLRLAKVDADPKVEKIELNSIVNEIRLNLDALLKDKSGQILADELPALMADRTQILQLFQNIIGNGIKYNESEQPTIVIKHEIKDNELRLSIADNGIGIPVHYREKAFQIFQRVPTAKKYAGSGIGLAICKKIVDNMSGKIWIEDNPGGGTLFAMAFNNSLIAQ